MTVALTYYLKEGCGLARPFCPNCTNTFKSVTCNSPCSNGPTIICLTPTIPGPVGWMTFCSKTIPQPAPPALVLQMSDGIELTLDGDSLSPNGGHAKCKPILDPIALLYVADNSKIAFPSPYVTTTFINENFIVYESDYISWPGPSNPEDQCFSGKVKFQYIILRPPYLVNTFDNIDLQNTFPCGYKVVRLILNGDGHQGFEGQICGGVSQSTIYPGGGAYTDLVQNGIELIPFSDPNRDVTFGATGLEICELVGGPSADPYYGHLLGTSYVNIFPAVGYIPFTIKMPTI